MHFQFTEEHLMIQKAARDFARTECLPGVIERDEHQKFPREQVLKLAELGFMGMMVDPDYGGSGMDTISYVLAMEEISKIDASVSVCMSVNNSLVCWGLNAFATDAQKRKYLTPLAQGRKDGELYIGAFLLSEGQRGPLFAQRRKELDHQREYCFRLPGDGADGCRQRQPRHQRLYSREEQFRCKCRCKRK
jgi:alkylation response protein AidB-like acyl-CoA dehydrogenase